MKKTAKLLALLLAVLTMAVMLTACGEKEEKVDTLTRAKVTDAEIVLPEGMDPEASYAAQFTETGMTLVFNGNNKWDTDYFTVPSGTLSIRAKATGEASGMRSFKIALWEKVDGGAQYVDKSTVYYYTVGKDAAGDMHTYTLEGLDPNAQYRLTLSYDAYGYHIFGQMQVDGAAPLA